VLDRGGNGGGTGRRGRAGPGGVGIDELEDGTVGAEDAEASWSVPLNPA